MCPRCETLKPGPEFYRDRYSTKGLSSYCIPCSKENARLKYVANPSPAKRYAKAWEKRTLEANPHFYRDRNIRWRFKLTPEEWNAKFENQGRCCDLCRNEVAERLAVDHDHACCPGKVSCGRCVRGLLCGKCNWGLGAFGDSPHLLAMAQEYLTRWAA